MRLAKLDWRTLGLIVLSLAALLVCKPVWASPSMPSTMGSAPTREQVRKAVESLHSDPLIGQTKTHKILKLKDFNKKNTPPKHESKFPKWKWLKDFALWAGGEFRLIMWTFIVIVTVLVLWLLIRAIRSGSALGSKIKSDPTAPSFVQSLDIRQESLPADIGQAAAQLWEQGEQRQALALLYRGALSRLVFLYKLPIESSSTEGECLHLARSLLEESRWGYFAHLVRVWLNAIYGLHMPPSVEALSLCKQFDLSLPANSASVSAGVSA